MGDVGRPTVMTEETVKQLEAAFSNGATDLEACFIANISKQTLYNYQDEHPGFVDRKEALKEMVKYQAKVNVKDKIVRGDTPTSQWYLERKGKDEGFSNRTELTSANGKELIKKDIEDEEFETLMSTYESNKKAKTTDGEESVE